MAAVAAPADDGGYAPASSATVLDSYLDAIGASDALDATAEKIVATAQPAPVVEDPGEGDLFPRHGARNQRRVSRGAAGRGAVQRARPALRTPSHPQ